MLELSEVLRQQGYSNSPHFFDLRLDSTLRNAPAQGASQLREARAAGLQGVYTFETQPSSGTDLWNRRIALGLAEASAEGGETEARQLHRNVWNLGGVPFLLVVLPHQVRLYSGFSYSSPGQLEGPEEGLLETIAWRRSQLQPSTAARSGPAVTAGSSISKPASTALSSRLSRVSARSCAMREISRPRSTMA